MAGTADRGSDRRNVDLIWTVSELSGLFERRTNVGEFLQDVVELISSHLDADVCSIYLYDEEADALVLRATRGLNPESVGTFQLRLGEGITGQALKELRPIREADAAESPYFKLISQTHEEAFRSFLAVPIRRGLNRIGVMVVQHREPAFFETQDTRALQAIASHLAATLENVEVLMEIHGQKAERSRDDEGATPVVRGKSASPGLGRGRSVIFGRRTEQLQAAARDGNHGTTVQGTIVQGATVQGTGAQDTTGQGATVQGTGAQDTTGHGAVSSESKQQRHAVEDADEAVERFARALEATQRQLESLQQDVGEDLADVASLIFSSHLLMLKDEEFGGQITRQIRNGVPPEQAIASVINQYVTLFSNSGNTRTQEKTQDVQDLGHRLLRNLESTEDEAGDYRGQIIIAPELFPSELVKVSLQHVEGLILQDGGLTAHISLLARSLGLPVLLTQEERVFRLPEGTDLVLDADHATLYINPDQQVRDAFEENLETHRRKALEDESIPAETVTADGERVIVMANVNIVQDVRHALHYKAEGIGLYRSEFPFIVRSDFPTEEEQYQIYRRVVKSMGQRTVVLRTLDIGGDKLLPQPGMIESNPFLGYRGIRFSLANRDLFREQLRAMLRAGSDADLHLLLPMISSIDELHEARELTEQCIAELQQEETPCNSRPKIGAMVECPSAVEAVESLSRGSDFLSLGTNDLVMYLLAVDRTNDRVGHMYKSYHPSVLHALERIMTGARNARETVSICGDAGADLTMLPFLLGIGLRRFSVDPRQLPSLKRALAGLEITECERQAQEMLALKTVSQVEAYLGVLPDAAG